MTTLDPSARLITAADFVIAFGKALGPFVVCLFLVEAATGKVIDYSPALTTGLVSFVFCCVLFSPVVKSNDRLLVRNRQ